MTYKIGVCIPTFFRVYGLRRILQSIRDTAKFANIPGVQVVASVANEPDDVNARIVSKEYGATLATCPIRRNGTANAWNNAMAAEPDCDAYILGSDDLYFMYGWLEEVMMYVNQGYGLVGFNDNDIRELRVDKRTCKIIRNPDYVCHYLMTREFIIQHHGGVMAIPWYDGWWLDVEACQRAKRVGMLIHALDANIKHDWKGAAGTGGHYERNKQIYDARKKANFPNDFEAVIQ